MVLARRELIAKIRSVGAVFCESTIDEDHRPQGREATGDDIPDDVFLGPSYPAPSISDRLLEPQKSWDPRVVENPDSILADLHLLSGLRILTLRSAKISNESLRYLEELSRLEYLDLGKTAVDDAATYHLLRLPQLRYLLIDGTTISEMAIRELQKKNPRLEIIR